MPLILNGDGSVGPLSSTEVGYLDGVTSAVQTQINTKLTTPGAWLSYVPTWTATGTQPSIGNGVISGRYIKYGSVVSFSLVMSTGTTTTYGTGSWLFGLPITMVNTNDANGFVGRVDESGVQTISVSGYQQTTTTFYVQNTRASALLGPTTPFTWAGAGDTLWISGTYEAAA